VPTLYCFPADVELQPTARDVEGHVTLELSSRDVGRSPTPPVAPQPAARDRAELGIVAVSENEQTKTLEDVVSPGRIVIVVDEDPVESQIRRATSCRTPPPCRAEVVACAPESDLSVADFLGDPRRSVTVSIVHDEESIGRPRLAKQCLERLPKVYWTLPGTRTPRRWAPHRS
jgi:hypothetical protein